MIPPLYKVPQSVPNLVRISPPKYPFKKPSPSHQQITEETEPNQNIIKETKKITQQKNQTKVIAEFDQIEPEIIEIPPPSHIFALQEINSSEQLSSAHIQFGPQKTQTSEFSQQYEIDSEQNEFLNLQKRKIEELQNIAHQTQQQMYKTPEMHQEEPSYFYQIASEMLSKYLIAQQQEPIQNEHSDDILKTVLIKQNKLKEYLEYLQQLKEKVLKNQLNSQIQSFQDDRLLNTGTQFHLSFLKRQRKNGGRKTINNIGVLSALLAKLFQQNPYVHITHVQIPVNNGHYSSRTSPNKNQEIKTVSKITHIQFGGKEQRKYQIKYKQIKQRLEQKERQFQKIQFQYNRVVENYAIAYQNIHDKIQSKHQAQNKAGFIIMEENKKNDFMKDSNGDHSFSISQPITFMQSIKMEEQNANFILEEDNSDKNIFEGKRNTEPTLKKIKI